MAYIKVDHKKMLSVADAIDVYVSEFNKSMNNIDNVLVSLNTEWKGDDYNQLAVEWMEINSAGSTSDNMKISMQSYAGSIREASKEYKEAQARAINRANSLCKL